MVSKKDVITFKISEWISDDEKSYFWSLAQKMGKSLYNRQSDSDRNRQIKAYIGLIAESLITNLIAELGINSKFDGLTGEGTNRKSDEYDFAINGITVDIKSSQEKQSAPYVDWKGKSYSDYVEFALENRNFTLPKDQSVKDYLLQVLFDEKGEYAYVFSAISGKELKSKRVVDLKVSKNGVQPTHMEKLKNGMAFEEFIKKIA